VQRTADKAEAQAVLDASDPGAAVIVNGKPVNIPSVKDAVRALAGVDRGKDIWVIGDQNTLKRVEDGTPTPAAGTQFLTLDPLPAAPQAHATEPAAAPTAAPVAP
jgi:hypothetical protein